MTDKASVIVFSPPFVDLIEDKFFLKAEDADGRSWDLVGPIPDERIAILIRAALSGLKDGWGYLSVLKDLLSSQCADGY